uniref:ABI family, member 3 (NESH) binding protein a n=1 Tax=Gasterosteus aculeatus aculeatus TaxID=481459 RepID=A0AAQ4PNB3_GASAC
MTFERQNMKVRINATGDTIVMKFLHPNAGTKLEGYILGYGSSMFSKQFIQLPENGQPYETEFDAEPKYLIAVQPIPNNEVKKHCTGKVELQKPLHLVIGSVTPTSVLLSWGTLLKTPHEGNIMNDCLEDGHYTVRYRERSRKWHYQTCPTSDTVIDNLRPNAVYEFGVQPTSKDGTGVWSKPVIHNIIQKPKPKPVTQTQPQHKPNYPMSQPEPHTKRPSQSQIQTHPLSRLQTTHQPKLQTKPQSQSRQKPHPQVQPQTSTHPRDEPQPQPTLQPINLVKPQTQLHSTTQPEVQTPQPQYTPTTLPQTPIQTQTNINPQFSLKTNPQAQLTTTQQSKDQQTRKPKISFPQPKLKTQHQTKNQSQGKPRTRDWHEAHTKIQPLLQTQPPTKNKAKPLPGYGWPPQSHPELLSPVFFSASRFDINENSSIFRPMPASDVDFMGKKRFVAPHVIYKTDKKPDEPCSITSSLAFFPDEEGGDQNVTGPPRIPPSNLTVVTVEGCPSFVILDWQKSDNDTREYEVVSTTKGPNGDEVSVLTTNQTHTAVENLKPESSYEFTVTPKNDMGVGPSSDPVSFSTESADPRVSEHVSGKDAIWTQFPFKSDDYSECNGKQYVKRTWYRKFVGIQLCNSLRYKIYLSDSLNGKFYNIGDQSGHGEDHCQFVDSFLDGRTGTQLLADQLQSRPGFYRALRQEPVYFGEIGGKSHVTYVGWYECGTPIPGKW